VAPFYYRNARAAIAVYDQTSQGSFNSLETWIGDLTKVAKRPIIAIAANKSDLPDRFVDLTEAEKWAQEHNYIFYQTSALTGEGIHDLFQMVVNALNHPQLPQNDALPEKQRDKKCC
jgi:GTPase SAR1 family protein